MDVAQMISNYVDFVTNAFEEGYLDENFFILQKVKVDLNQPQFVVETVTNCLANTEQTIVDISHALHQTAADFPKVFEFLHLLKGSCSSIGAKKVLDVIVDFKRHCEDYNFICCLACFNDLSQEYSLVKERFETIFNMERQIVAAGGAVPVLDLGA